MLIWHYILHSVHLIFIFIYLNLIIDTKGEVPDHRITGQFRNKSSRIWDPHPQYVIDAFGIRMHLVLNQDASFIPKDMKVSFNNLKNIFY